jgi:two-component system OmpR family response regulator
MNAVAEEGCMGSLKVLVIDDEPEMVEIARAYFEMAGWSVVEALNVAQATAILEQGPVDAVLSDVSLEPGRTGFDVLTWIQQKLAVQPVFFLISGDGDSHVERAEQMGVKAIFTKPCSWTEVVKRVADTVAIRTAESSAS